MFAMCMCLSVPISRCCCSLIVDRNFLLVQMSLISLFSILPSFSQSNALRRHPGYPHRQRPQQSSVPRYFVVVFLLRLLLSCSCYFPIVIVHVFLVLYRWLTIIVGFRFRTILICEFLKRRKLCPLNLSFSLSSLLILSAACPYILSSPPSIHFPPPRFHFTSFSCSPLCYLLLHVLLHSSSSAGSTIA
jgi:hypothetical protein